MFPDRRIKIEGIKCVKLEEKLWLFTNTLKATRTLIAVFELFVLPKDSQHSHTALTFVSQPGNDSLLDGSDASRLELLSIFSSP